MTQTTENTETKTTAIERALAAAKARKAAKAAATAAPEATTESHVETERTLEETVAAAPEDVKAKLAADRAARKEAKAAREAAEAEAKALRKAERAAKKAAKAAAKESPVAKGPTHMKKVDRARSKLPSLGAEGSRLFEEITSNLSISGIEALSLHLAVQARAMKTLRANNLTPLPLGATVRVTGGEAKYVGTVGTVIHSQRLRAKVRLPDMPEGKYVYIYTGEAEVVEPSAVAAAE